MTPEMHDTLLVLLSFAAAVVLLLLGMRLDKYMAARRTAQAITAEMDAPPTCPWYQQLGSWAKRHVTLLGVAASLVALLLSYRYLPGVTYWFNNAQPVSPSQVNLDGAQIYAETQAGGQRQFGAVWTVLLTGTFYFSVEVAAIWSLMAFITPALPPWAKKYFSLGFKNMGDTGYDPAASLSLPLQFAVHLIVWFGMWFMYLGSLLVAAILQ